MTQTLPTVLIVDDSATTRSMITRVIRMTGVPVGSLVEASNGREAMEVMQNSTIHLVLADLNMPVMDGIAMIAEMRQNDRLKAIPIVVISAQPDEEQIERLKNAGVRGYLPKPFTPEGVREIIGPVLMEIEQASAVVSPAPDEVFNLNLAEALAEALETMAFISPEMAEGVELIAPEELRVARVAFSGHGFQGSMSLSAPHGFGIAVARSCAVNDAEGQADDALKELANVTCGLFLRKRLGGAKGFVLEPPVLGTGLRALTVSGESDCVTLKAEGFVVAAHVTPEEAAAA